MLKRIDVYVTSRSFNIFMDGTVISLPKTDTGDKSKTIFGIRHFLWWLEHNPGPENIFIDRVANWLYNNSMRALDYIGDKNNIVKERMLVRTDTSINRVRITNDIAKEFFDNMYEDEMILRIISEYVLHNKNKTFADPKGEVATQINTKLNRGDVDSLIILSLYTKIFIMFTGIYNEIQPSVGVGLLNKIDTYLRSFPEGTKIGEESTYDSLVDFTMKKTARGMMKNSKLIEKFKIQGLTEETVIMNIKRTIFKTSLGTYIPQYNLSLLDSDPIIKGVVDEKEVMSLKTQLVKEIEHDIRATIRPKKDKNGKKATVLLSEMGLEYYHLYAYSDNMFLSFITTVIESTALHNTSMHGPKVSLKIIPSSPSGGGSAADMVSKHDSFISKFDKEALMDNEIIMKELTSELYEKLKDVSFDEPIDIREIIIFNKLAKVLLDDYSEHTYDVVLYECTDELVSLLLLDFIYMLKQEGFIELPKALVKSNRIENNISKRTKSYVDIDIFEDSIQFKATGKLYLSRIQNLLDVKFEGVRHKVLDVELANYLRR